MIGYPNRKKADANAARPVDYSNRGMPLEDDINATNAYYLDIDRAAVYKKPIPIRIVSVQYRTRQTAKITEAYYQTPSTTDYNGVYRGRYLDFEAKETHSRSSMPMKIIHPHQLEHLRRVIRYGGIAFLIIRFVVLDETYYVPADSVLPEFDAGVKSLPHRWFTEHGRLIPYHYNIRVDYLSVIDEINMEDKHQ